MIHGFPLTKSLTAYNPALFADDCIKISPSIGWFELATLATEAKAARKELGEV